MRLLKLNAIDSTNDFLKSMAADQPVENYTVVSAESQLKGKGQMGAKWISEEGKNLIMSILVNDIQIDASKLFLLNAAVAISVSEVLEHNNIGEIRIKWPNDIMAGNKKIGGILIENTFIGQTIRSVIGIGLNVNQKSFENLPRASSLLVHTGKEWDKEKLLPEIVNAIKRNLADLTSTERSLLQQYNDKLFRHGMCTTFKTAAGLMELEILDVLVDGLLRVRNTDGEVLKFDLKQLEMIY